MNDASKMIIKQTKMLVYLAVAFIIATAIVCTKSVHPIDYFIICEMFWFVSIIFSYAVVGSVAGQIALGIEDIYRTSTRVGSFLQLFFCGAGFVAFIIMLI